MIVLQIYVDADACPVKKEIEQVATRHKINVILVSNGGIRPSINPIIKIVVVDQGLDKADNYISKKEFAAAEKVLKSILSAHPTNKKAKRGIKNIQMSLSNSQPVVLEPNPDIRKSILFLYNNGLFYDGKHGSDGWNMG